MTAPTMRQLYAEHKDKVSDKWSSYLDTYDELFSPYCDRQIRILEIGVQNGGSLEIWSKYFPKAALLVGCDADKACRTLQYADPRIQLVIGDANARAVQDEILRLSTDFDIIIDDGSHRSADIVSSFCRYFPRLRTDGLYVAEDLHCSYWAHFQGGLFAPLSSISFFKRLADLINFEHWGVPGTRTDLLRSFTDAYGCAALAEDLAGIYSVEFRNSICVVRKRTADETRLGSRVVAGLAAEINPQCVALGGTTISGADEATNGWSDLGHLPEVELVELRKSCSALTQELQRARLELNSVYSSRSWRLTSPLRRLASSLRRRTGASDMAGAATSTPTRAYSRIRSVISRAIQR
jgi:hypothetical protein